MKKKALVIFGTRPETIKLCPVIRQLKEKSDEISTVVCVTAQHREMLDPFLNTFGVIPDYDLDLMKKSQSLFDITSRSLVETGKIIKIEKPSVVIVQGDTTTTFSASLASFYHQTKVAHVEAGLRTGSKYSPFPEEINRRLTTVVADFHFAPTEKARRNLLADGIGEEQIVVTGNTVIDALLWMKNKNYTENKSFRFQNILDSGKNIILVTGHRRENFGEDMVNICKAIRTIAENHKDVEIVYPVHLNPNVRKPVYEILGNQENIKLIDPLIYSEFITLMDKCHFIISDSGGIQEEAPSLKKPVLVTRDTTERSEALNVGAIKLVGSNRETIVESSMKLLTDEDYYNGFIVDYNPYGDGNASIRIVDYLINEI